MQRRIVIHTVHQALRLGLSQHRRQRVRQFRRHQHGRRIGLDPAMLMRPSEKRTDRHDLAGHAGAGVVAGLERHPSTQVVGRDLTQICDAARCQCMQALPDIGAVRLHRIVRQSPVGPQIRKERGQVTIAIHAHSFLCRFYPAKPRFTH